MDILSKGDEHQKTEKPVPAAGGGKTTGSTVISKPGEEYTALQISELKYRRLFETAQDGILILDGDTGQVTDVNPFLTDLLGYSKKELEGKTLWEIGLFEDISASKRAFEELESNGYIRYSDLPLKTKDKRQVEVEFVSNKYNVNGSKIIQCNIRDNTSHKKLEDALDASEEQYRILVENASEGISLSQGGMFKFVNRRAADIVGYSKEELLAIHSIDIIYQDDRDRVISRYRKILDGSSPSGIYDFRIISKTGAIRWIESNVVQLDWQGKPAILSFMNDVTDRKQIGEKLAESEERYRSLVERASDGICVIQDNIVKYCNQYLAKMWGGNIEEIIGVPFLDFVCPDSRPKVADNYRRRISGEDLPAIYESRLKRRDGTGFDAELNAGIFPYQGKPANLVIIRDITERKKVENQIQQSKTLMQAVIDSTPDRIAVKDSQHHYLLVNKSLASALNCQPQDMIGKLDSEFFSQEQLNGNRERGIRSTREDEATAFSGEVVRGVSRTGDEPGNSLIFDSYRVPLKDPSGSIYGVLVYNRDITELYTATENLKKSYQRTEKALDETIAAIGRICEIRDPYTAGHQTRVSQLACALAAEIGLTEDTIYNIKIGGILHDIGKIYVPAEILSKPGKLSEMEFAIIKNHPLVGYDIIKGIDLPIAVSQIVLQHHERLDGSGYPHGLTAEDITIEAKIIAVADVVEAMSSHRPYRPALGIDKALEEISMNKGKLYDPVVSNACLNLFNEKSFKFAE